MEQWAGHLAPRTVRVQHPRLTTTKIRKNKEAPPRRDEEGLHFLYIKGYSNFVVDSYTNCHPPPWKPGLRQPIRLSLSGKLQCRFGARNHTVHGSRVGRSLPCSLFSALCFWGRGFCLRPPLAIIGKLSPHLFPKCQHILRG